MSEQWTHRCLICATRDKITKLPSGHCCPACVARLGDDLASIVLNGDLSAVSERTTSVGYASAGYESKPPTDLDRAAPYLVLVRLNPGQTPAVSRSVSDLVCDWERLLREERGLGAYGPATAHHVGVDEGVLAAQAVRQAVALLRAHLEWITSEPTWPLEDFALEVRRCASRLLALASPDTARDRMVACPTLTTRRDASEVDALTMCGWRLTVRTWAALDAHESANGRRDWSIGEDVTCPRCQVTRSPEQLLHAAGKDGTWADPEAIANWYGIAERTLRKWAAKGLVRREHGRYSVSDVEARRDAPGVGA